MLAAPASAQTGLTGGAVQGTVRSETGQPLGDVTVSLVAEGTGITRTVVTDAEGGYRIAALPPALGQVLVVDVSLALARSETVSVHHEGTASGNEGASVYDPDAYSYLEVQRQAGSAWATVATDGDPYTTFDWVRTEVLSRRPPMRRSPGSSGTRFPALIEWSTGG